MLKFWSDSIAFYFPILDKNPLNISFALVLHTFVSCLQNEQQEKVSDTFLQTIWLSGVISNAIF